jgi:hypothetical protein
LWAFFRGNVGYITGHVRTLFYTFSRSPHEIRRLVSALVIPLFFRALSFIFSLYFSLWIILSQIQWFPTWISGSLRWAIFRIWKRASGYRITCPIT